MALVVLLGGSLAACGADDGPEGDASSATSVVTGSDGVLAVDGDGTTAVDPSALADEFAAAPAGTPDATEVAGLLFMVEEEKLALDVYTTLGATWDLPTFTNIAAAEATHVDAVGALLDRYAIADPTEGKAVGEYADARFTTLYQDLVTRGQTSAVSALEVGALIEELDIVDLDLRLAQTDEAPITTVYESLQAGSRNHLRAFDRALDARGVTYEPVHLDQASYDAIVSSGVERGGRTG
jgi:hypothetical protein